MSIRRFVVAGIAVMACAGAARAVDLAGFELGKELTASTRAELTRGELGHCSETVCLGSKQLGDYPAIVMLQANPEGRIQLISVTMPVERKNVLLQSAVAKFGKPSKMSTSEVQNRFGAKFSQSAVGWKSKAGDLVIYLERCAKVTESCLIATSKNFVDPDAGKKLAL